MENSTSSRDGRIIKNVSDIQRLVGSSTVKRLEEAKV